MAVDSDVTLKNRRKNRDIVQNDFDYVIYMYIWYFHTRVYKNICFNFFFWVAYLERKNRKNYWIFLILSCWSFISQSQWLEYYHNYLHVHVNTLFFMFSIKFELWKEILLQCDLKRLNSVYLNFFTKTFLLLKTMQQLHMYYKPLGWSHGELRPRKKFP